MSETLRRIQNLVVGEKLRISAHGYEELADDDILVMEVVSGVCEGVMVEDYPDYVKGPCVLVLQRDSEGEAIHAVWGIPRGASEPAVLITAYRPDPEKWNDDFSRRKS